MTTTPKSPEASANVRPGFPLVVLGDFGRGRCVPPSRPVHVAELGLLGRRAYGAL